MKILKLLKRLKPLGAIAIATASTILVIVPKPSLAATFRNGWQYALDPSYDSYGSVDGNIQVGGTIYETYGIAIKEDHETDTIWVALNTKMPLLGNPTGPELCVLNQAGTEVCYPVRNGSVAWGDVFIDLSGTGNLETAFELGEVLGIRFAPNNDSSLETGVYRAVTGKNVAGENAGFQNIYQNRQFAKDRGLGDLETWMGDLAWNNPYFGSYSQPGNWDTGEGIMPNLIDDNVVTSADKIADITIRNKDELIAQGYDPGWFFQDGEETFGFSFPKTAEFIGDFVMTLLQECINEGISLIGQFTNPTLDDPEPEPELCPIPMQNNQQYILEPTQTDDITGAKYYENAFSHLWYDPDPSMGYNFSGLPGTLFTGILNFPCGLTSITEDFTYSVSVGDVLLGDDFTIDNPLNFSDYADQLGDLLVTDGNNKQGVQEFVITGFEQWTPLIPIEGITPEEKIQMALQVSTNIEDPDFVITPVTVPEPRFVLSLISFGLLGLKLRRKPHKSE